MKIISLVTILVCLLFNINSFSQAWSNVGNSNVCASGVNQLVQYNNNIYASGVPQITSWSGASWSNFAYVNSPDKIWCVTVYQNDIYVCGNFSFIGTVGASNIAKYNGTSWSAVGAGLSGTVTGMAVYNNELYAFGYQGDSIFNNMPMARWNGTTWSSLPGNNYFYGYVNDATVFQNELYVVGSFYSMGGVSVSNIARFNGTSWSSVGSGTNYITNTLLANANELYAGGYFTAAGGISASCIAKWDGSNWSSLGSGVGGTDHAGGLPAVHGLAFYDSHLYAGGQFSIAGTGPGSDLAYWDGNDWYNVRMAGGGNCGGVYALSVFDSDNSLWVAGLFDTAGTIPAANIARYTIITSVNENISSGVASVFPNPSTGMINLQFENTIDQKIISVYDLMENRIFSQTLTAATKNFALNLSEFSSGIYLLNIETTTGITNRKIAIQKY